MSIARRIYWIAVDFLFFWGCVFQTGFFAVVRLVLTLSPRRPR